LQVSLFATGLPSARFLALGPHGVLFVGSTGGTVSVLASAVPMRAPARASLKSREDGLSRGPQRIGPPYVQATLLDLAFQGATA
jgi:hypothetical protein